MYTWNLYLVYLQMPQELPRLEAVEGGNPLIRNLAWSSRLTCQSRKLLTLVTVHVSLKLNHRFGKQDVNVIIIIYMPLALDMLCLCEKQVILK